MGPNRSKFRSIPLTEKLPLYFIITGLLSILIVGIFAFYSARNAMLDRTFDQLTSVRIEKQKRIDKFFEDCEFIVSTVDKGPLTKHNDDTYLCELSQNQLLNASAWSYFEQIWLVNLELNKPTGPDVPFNPKKFLTKNEAFVYMDSPNGVFLGKGFTFENKNYQLIFKVRQSSIDDIMLEINPHNGLGESGEVYLVGKDSLMKSQSRFIDESVNQIVVNTSSVSRALKHLTGIQIIEDYRGVRVLSAYSNIDLPQLNWAILSELDEQEAMIPAYKLRNKIMVSSVVISLLLLIISFTISRRLIRPLTSLSKKAIQVGKGQFEKMDEPLTDDEIGDLARSFNYMIDELKNKDLALQAEKVKQLRSMIDGQELERQRFSRELHDGIGQLLFGMKMKLEKLFISKSTSLENDERSLLDNFDHTIDEVRRLSNNLKPAVLEDFGISKALSNLCKEIKATSEFSVISSIEEPNVKLSRRAQTYLFRIAQEALNNIIKHAKARNVSINFYQEENSIILSIEDDGIGFDPESSRLSMGNGLNNMIERANLLKATFDIHSVPGRGTIITLSIQQNCQD